MGEATAVFRAQVKRLRRARNWTAERLAERCREIGAPSFSVARVNNIETRRAGVTIDELVAIAAAFDVEPGVLLAAAQCDRCGGAPPVGFTCNDCGREGVGG